LGDDMQAQVEAAFDRVRSRCVDRDFLAQELLDVVSRDRVSAFPWRGQFTPGLVGTLLDSYGQAGSTVLDPFAGSGTTLAEATRRGMTAIGTEVNPAAAELARVYTLSGHDPSARKQALAGAGQLLANCLLQGEASLFGNMGGDLRDQLAKIYEECSSPDGESDRRNNDAGNGRHGLA